MFAQIRQHKFMCIHASQVITSFRSTPRHNATTPRLKSLRKPLGPKKVEGKPQSLSSHMSHLISCLDFFWQKYSPYGSGPKSETASNNDWGVPDVGMTSLTDY